MRIQKPCSTSKPVTYSPGAIDSLWNSGHVAGSHSIAGVAKDGSFGWLAKGNALEIFDVKSGQRLAAWCFGAAIRDPSTFITAVCEFDNDRATSAQLVVASTTANVRPQGGLICLFDVHRSSVVKAIQFPHKVTALETASAVSPGEPVTLMLCKQLQSFCGIVAVGTQNGNLYLLDMCTDDGVNSNELTPRQVELIDPSISDVLTIRYQAIGKHCHLCMKLGDSLSHKDTFAYSNADGTVQCQLKSSEVFISSVIFIKQAMLLLVGYSFGGFQLWNLRGPVLQYSSRWEETLPAVTHFAFQEPENDPRDYCYIWVVHGPTASDTVKNTSSHASLYQLNYKQKRWIEGFGFSYDNLGSLAVRFNHVLQLNPYNPIASSDCGSRVISCYTLENHHFGLPAISANETLPDEGLSPDRSLCLFVWEALSLDEDVSNRCFLAIFDINLWYHAQLPLSLSSYRSQSVCPYWAVCSLDEAVQNICPELLLMVYINFNDLHRFMLPFSPVCEKFVQPSALSFSAHCISDSGIVCSKFLGIQRLIFGYIQKHGARVLLDPNDIYFACLQSGLINMYSPVGKLTVSQKRESLLSTALDCNLIGFLVSCIRQLGTAEFVVEGFTLRNILEWAWRRLTDCKESVDRLCVPLFDWSSSGFNELDVKQLHYHKAIVRHLVTIFETLNDHSSATTDQGKEELATRLKIASLIAEYLDVIVWFHVAGLIPEHSEEDALDDSEFAFPKEALSSAYRARRQSIQQLNRNASSSAVMIIDALLEEEGASISNLFEQECGVRYYPPTSFHALISIYLLPDVSPKTKHTVVLYLLRDLTFCVGYERASKIEELSRQFCSAFQIQPSLDKRIQGFWLLDHQHFQEAAAVLFDASLDDDVAPWQHDCIIRAFMCQDHERLALKYIKVKRVPALTADDVKLKMTVLLANGLTAEALDYQRAHRDNILMEDLMSHLIHACLETNAIGELLSLPLTKEEESNLVKCLQNSDNPVCRNLLVLYFIQQSRLIDAIDTNGHMKTRVSSGEQEKVLDAVVEGYTNALPLVQRKMGLEMQTFHRFPGSHKEYVRPTPLSTALHRLQGEQNVVTKAAMLRTVLDKVHQINIPDGHVIDTEPCSTDDCEVPGDQKAVLFATPVVPLSVKKTRVSMINDVVFPSSNVKDRLLPNFTRVLESPIPVTNPATNRLFSAAALSLLQTPPVTKRRTIIAASISQTGLQPQSILSTKRQKPSDSSSLGHPSIAGVLKFDDVGNSSPVTASVPSLAQLIDDIATLPRSRTLRFKEPEVASSPEPASQPNQSLISESGEVYMDAPEGEASTASEDATESDTDAYPLDDENDENANNSAVKPSVYSTGSFDSLGSYMDQEEMIIDEDEIPDSNLESVSVGQQMAFGSSLSPLCRPPLWQDEDMKQQKFVSGSELNLSKSSPVKENSVITVSTEIGLQTSMSHDSEDEVPEQDSLLRASKSAEKDSPSTPARRSARVLMKKDVAEEEGLAGEDNEDQKKPRRSVRSPSRELLDSSKELSGTSEQQITVDKSTVGTRRSVRSPSREIFDVAGDISEPVREPIPEDGLKLTEVEPPLTPTRRRSVRSPARETVAENSVEAEELKADQPMTPTRRRSMRSPGREVVEPAGDGLHQGEELTVEPPGTPTRRRSVRSPGREISIQLTPEEKESIIDQAMKSTRRRSVRSPGREISIHLTPEEKESIIDQVMMSTRRRSFRSPGRETSIQSTENAPEEKESLIDVSMTSTRRRSVRSPGRETLDPVTSSSEEVVIVEQSTVGTRRRSVRSPGREVADPLEGQEKSIVDQLTTPTRRRSTRSPGRDAADPFKNLSEEKLPASDSVQPSNQDDQPVTSVRRRSVRSPSREVVPPVEKSTSESELPMTTEPTTLKRRRSVQSPTREAAGKVADEDLELKADQSVITTRRRSLRSPGRESVDPLTEKSTEEDVELRDNRPETPTRRRSLRSPSRSRTEEVSGSEAAELSGDEHNLRKRRKSVQSEDRDTSSQVASKESPSTPTRRRSVRSPSRGSNKQSPKTISSTEQAEPEDISRSVSSPAQDVDTLVINTAQSVETKMDVTAESDVSTRRRFVRSPSRERIVISELLTPVRRSTRQKEKQDKTLETTVTTEKSPLQDETSKAGVSPARSNTGRGKPQQTPTVSKSFVQSRQEGRKPLTRGDARRMREIEQQVTPPDVTPQARSVRRSPGRPAKRQIVEAEPIVNLPQERAVTAAVFAPPLEPVFLETSAVNSGRPTEQRFFVFSAPLNTDNNREASESIPDISSQRSTFVFSPPHTRLRDRTASEPIESEVTKQEGSTPTTAADDKRETKPARSAETGRALRTAKIVRSNKTLVNRRKRARTVATGASEDVPILLSPISDTEPSPRAPTNAQSRKRSMRFSYVTRSKRKKVVSSDPPIFW